MRNKTYYTNDEIVTDLYTQGKEWMTEDYIEYIGPYHTYITGEVYPEPTYNKEFSQKLIEFKEINKDPNNIIYRILNDVKTDYNSFNFYQVNITSEDIATGTINRYFIKKINSTNIIEIDQTEYDNWSGGTSGSIDISKVWPDGRDAIVALAATKDSLIIFGKHSIVVYSGAAEPSSMALQETVYSVG